MIDFIFNVIFWILALYGLYEVIKNIIYISTYTKLKDKGTYVIVAVKDQEETIEGFLRSFLFKTIHEKKVGVKDVIIVDLKSKDNTKEIIKKLSKENQYIKLMNWKECKELIDDENQK